PSLAPPQCSRPTSYSKLRTTSCQSFVGASARGCWWHWSLLSPIRTPTWTTASLLSHNRISLALVPGGSCRPPETYAPPPVKSALILSDPFPSRPTLASKVCDP